MLSTYLTRHSRQQGVSLVELMVGMVVALLVIAAAGAGLITTSRGSRDTLNSSKLNTALRGSMDIMTTDIRRAGSWGMPMAGSPGDNPFMNPTAGGPRTDINVSADGTCIEYAYDTNGDGEVAAATPFEYAGFRIQNNAIQMRTGGGDEVNDCADGTWESMTDSTVVTVQQVDAGTPYFALAYQCLNTATNVSEAQSCTAGNTVFDAAAAGAAVDLLETRVVTINVAGQIANDAAMRMQLSQQVQIRNHRKVVAGTP